MFFGHGREVPLNSRDVLDRLELIKEKGCHHRPQVGLLLRVVQRTSLLDLVRRRKILRLVSLHHY